MKLISKTETLIRENLWLRIIVHGVLAGIMLALIFLRLYHTDLSTAPEFIYNQF